MNNANSRRIFFALWPSPETAQEMMAWARDAHALCGGRMMRAENLHLTLAFLGTTQAERVEQLVQAAPAWSIPTGSIVLQYFGRFEGPQVVWAGPAAYDEDRIPWLDQAYDTLWSHLDALGWQRSASVFRPHVSLLRKAGAGDLGVLQRPPLAWTPAQCVLVASRPSEMGSYYEVLARLRV